MAPAKPGKGKRRSKEYLNTVAAVEQLKQWHTASTRLSFKFRYGFFGFICLGKLVEQEPDGMSWIVQPENSDGFFYIMLRGVSVGVTKDPQPQVLLIDEQNIRCGIHITERPSGLLAGLPMLNELIH